MTENLAETVLSAQEAELAKEAQRCIMAALDHSRAHRIALIDIEDQLASSPTLELPPKVLRLFAELLAAMAERKPIALVPQEHELTTQEAAGFLNVSRPFLVKELESGRIPFRLVGRHRRVLLSDMVAYQRASKNRSARALQTLADEAQSLELGY